MGGCKGHYSFKPLLNFLFRFVLVCVLYHLGKYSTLSVDVDLNIMMMSAIHGPILWIKLLLYSILRNIMWNDNHCQEFYSYSNMIACFFPHCFPLVEFHLLGHMSVDWTLIVYNFTPFLVHFLFPKCEWRCDHYIPHPAPCCCVFPNNMDSPFGTRSQNELLLSKGPFAHDFFNHSNKD